MKKGILAAGATLALAATVMGQTDYAFPSPWNPAGRASNQVTQLVMITWDDNAYSGLARTGYETTPGATFAQQHFVDWLQPDPSAPGTGGPGCSPNSGWTACRPNDLNIVENNPTGNQQYMGMNWSLKAPAFQNTPMTYFMLAGFYVNIWSARTYPDPVFAWQDSESALGWYTGQQIGQPWVNSNQGYQRAPVAWGREHRAQSGGAMTQSNTIIRVSQEALALNHEIASHSMDHKETNSWIPGGSHQHASRGFGRWGNEGFRTTGRTSTTAWGQVVDLTVEYGQAGADLDRGWIAFAGRQISENAWHGAIRLADEWIMDNKGERDGGLGLSANTRGRLVNNQAQRRVYGFRAPRLESNSNMFFALKRAGYLYSSSLEEGNEMHVTGENFLWPYTVDNGIRNSWTEYDRGSRVFHDTMPTGIWEIPLNVVIVRPDDRPAVAASFNTINGALRAAGKAHSADINPATWHGKITAFDFNLFVHYAMTQDLFVRTMSHTLALRMGPGGNRAPFNVGAHTDYYTPIYDNGTLLNNFNRNDYGLVLNYNTWVDRKRGMERFVDEAKAAGARFVTCRALIDTLRAMNAEGEAIIQSTTALENSAFALWRDATRGGDTTLTASRTTLMAGPNRQGQQPVYRYDFERGKYSNLTHISLEYVSRTGTAVRLIVEPEPGNVGSRVVREVVLAHRYSRISYDGRVNQNFERGEFRQSGRIPLTAFDFTQYHTGRRNYSSINPAHIVGIEIAPLAPANNPPLHGQTPSFSERTEPFELAFQFRNIVLHRGTPKTWVEPDLPPLPVAIANTAVAGRTLSLAGITGNALKLNVAQSGKYDVKVFSANGRLLQSFNATNLTAGVVNTLKLNNLGKGVYMIQIQGIDNKQTLTRSALVL